VRLKNGTTYSATLIGTDSKTDVAVLKIKATGLTPAVIGDSDSLKVGDTAIAIGNPLGQLGGTVTEGIISALDRELVIDGKTMRLMQTDAAINPGNSGGGLFNDQGELVGIVVAKSSGSDVEGLGFAIPANTAKKVAGELMQYGYVKGRIDTGMTFIDLTSTQKALMYGVGKLGVYVKSVEAGSNAASAGFKSGDLITYVGDTKITSGTVLTQAFDKYKVGDTVKITVIRNGYSGQLSLKLGEYKPD
jgi:serine protease Do